MSCEAFQRWLDGGRPGTGEAPARLHAAACARCAAALRIAVEIDAELERFAVRAPATFTARVMARVEAADEARAAAQPLASPFDWWVRAAAEPATALALLVAGLMLWWGDTMRGVAVAAALRLAAVAAGLGAWLPSPLDRPGVPLALTLAALPFLLWASWRLYLFAERACGVPVGGARPAPGGFF